MDTFTPGSNADESVLYPDSHYKTRGRTPPSQRDRLARMRSPTPRGQGQHGPMCVCEMCNCGKHCCPAHGRKKAPFEAQSSYGQAFKGYAASELTETPQPKMEKRERSQTRFEGEASYQRDYQPPPADAFALALSQTKPQDNGRRKTPPKNPKGRAVFEGNSAYQRDYTPPPKDAFGQRTQEVTMTRVQAPKDKSSSRALFDGMSSSRRDFKPPPPDALRQNSAPPPELSRRMPQVKNEKARKGAVFEGTSQARRDYTPPPRDAYGRKESAPDTVGRTNNPSAAPRKFEGESMARRDFVPPPKDAYGAPKLPPEALAERGILGKSRSAPKFDGTSTHQREFAPPTREAYGQGSDTGRDTTPTRTLSRPRSARFEGASTSASHYTQPPKDAYSMATASTTQDLKRSGNKVSDNRDFQSTSARNYVRPPPPVQRCRASLLMAEGPPTPGSGRDHVYYDPATKSWY